MDNAQFLDKFRKLTQHDPFRWQICLFEKWLAQSRIPSALDIPTGLGKTAVMVLWYLALKAKAALPRRLVYVVDRRAVVDQATTVAEEIRERSQDVELRVSTLRGQLVDNREWLADPTTPAIVVGTVDMIGSRLLFSGYGVSRKMRPYHAGLLGADTLLVLDEAHLVPPFEKLLEKIANEAETFGPRKHEYRQIVPSFKLLSLSATGRDNGADAKAVFHLSPEHQKDAPARKRLTSKKRLTIQVLDDNKKLVPELADRAWPLAEGPSRVLVYCDRRDDAVRVKDEIDKKFKKEKRDHVSELLIGGRRIFEREKLAGWLKAQGFLGDVEEPPQQPTFLIATSAGEVGVDLDADHMVCDLVEWERMAQRLGRVNRRGSGDACIEVIAAPKKKISNKGAEEWEERLARLRAPLDELRLVDVEDVAEDSQFPLPLATGDADPIVESQKGPVQVSDREWPRDASPGAILDLRERAQNCLELQDKIIAATTPVPLRPALTRALVDAWSLTSLTEHTGRPDDIRPWLRGWEEDPQPQTTVVWRKYLPTRRNGEATSKEIEGFFEAAPPHASEKLETETSRVFEWIKKRTRKAISNQPGDSLRKDEVIAYVLSPARGLRHTLLGRDLADLSSKTGKEATNFKEKLYGATLVVDVRFGGLSEGGMLDDKANHPPRVLDDDEEWLPPQDHKPAIRFRVRSITGEKSSEPAGDWRERYRFIFEQSEEGDADAHLLVEKWRHDGETEDDRSVGHLQELTEHHDWIESKARTLAVTLKLPSEYSDMLAIAARLHDEGKRHMRWQQAIRVPADGKIYAKADKRMNTRLLDGYRHEFGSLTYVQKDDGFGALPAHLRELALHLIAAHHGFARPVISASGCDEPPSVSEARARDVALRFARLQRQWGPWGLAWWEALLRAADQQASRDNDTRGAS